MPTDANGNVADLIMDDISTAKRMNIGRLYEQYINASGDATTRRLKQMWGTGTVAEVERCKDYLWGFYKLVAPLMLPKLPTDPHEVMTHIWDVIQNGHYLYMPTNNPVEYDEATWQLSLEYPACYGPVTYRGRDGRKVTTRNNVLIGEMYFLLLEKVGNTWAGVASAKLQHYGIPAKITNADKYATPGRHQPVRILGETEARLFSAFCGGDVPAEILDQTNSPSVHQNIVENILDADQPTNIFAVVDRNVAPRGNGRMVTLTQHMIGCAGAEFVKGESDELLSG
jgi:hypothetical protein